MIIENGITVKENITFGARGVKGMGRRDLIVQTWEQMMSVDCQWKAPTKRMVALIIISCTIYKSN